MPVVRYSLFAKHGFHEQRIANDEQRNSDNRGPNFTHRLLAWGVLGLATGGCLFSLLTLLFSGAYLWKPSFTGKVAPALLFSRSF
jgi:hypothetical protein